MQLLARKALSDDRVQLEFKMDSAPDSDGKVMGGTGVESLVKVGDEWKFSNEIVKDRAWEQDGNVQKFVP
jgi:hypothetical protein